jgi:hypothetical protein
MTRLDLRIRIKALKDELENRHKTGISKMASSTGTPIPTLTLQDELFSLIYKLSKMDDLDS